MKLSVILSILLVYFQISVTAQNSNNCLVPEHQTVRYFIEIEANADRFDFKKYILQNVLEGSITTVESVPTLYDQEIDNLPKLSIANVESNIGKEEQTVEVYNDEDGTYTTEIHQIEPDLAEIKQIGFWEQWYVNPENFKFSKTILLYDFVRVFSPDNETEYKRIAFGINPSQTDTKGEFIGKYEYEVYIGAESFDIILEASYEQKEQWYASNSIFNSFSPNWNIYIYTNFLKLLFGKIESSQLEAYSLETGEQLAFTDVTKAMGAGIVEETVVDMETGQEKAVEIEQQMDIYTIKALHFVEDWYFNKKTLELTKEVKAIIPVRYYHNSIGGYNKEKVFEIRF